MKLGKIFICINILVLSLLMLTGCTEKWPRIIYQNTDYRFDEHNRTIVLDDGYSYDIVETEDGYDLILHFVEEQPLLAKQLSVFEFNPEFDLEAEEFSVYRNGEVYIERQICTRMLRIEGTYPYHIRES